MRILVIGTGQIDSASLHCVTALRGMGHEVKHFDPDEHPRLLVRLRQTERAKVYVNYALSFAGVYARIYERALFETVDAFGPDVILVIPLHALRAPVVEKLRSARTKVAGWYQDSFVNFGRHDFLLAPYDGLFFKDPYIVERLREGAGLTNVRYLPEACEPSRHRSLPLTEADRARFGCDLMVYGNLYPYRARILESLLDLDLKLYGGKPPGWLGHPAAARWQGSPVYYDDKIRAVLAARVVVSSSHYGEVRSVNARVFEVAGIGGFQVADAPGIAEFFEPGREIVTFRGPRDLRDVVHHYLDRPEERAAIAARGQARAHREHTFARRLARLLVEIGYPAALAHPGAGANGSAVEAFAPAAARDTSPNAS